MIIASFDMGIKNFAFCIEEIDREQLPNRINRSFQEDGSPTEEYQTQLDQVYKTGKILDAKNIDLTALLTKNHSDMDIYKILIQVLDSFSNYWNSTDIFLIEQQMAYGNNASNIKALRLSQHCISYFLTIYGSFKSVEEFSSCHKTRILGCPIKERSKYRLRKHFSISLTQYILEIRKDPYKQIHDILEKKDDIADCLLMIQAYKIKNIK